MKRNWMSIPVPIALLISTSSQAAPITTIGGPVRDWTSGATGEVQLYVGNLAPNNLDYSKSLGAAKVDTKGQFTLTLPDAAAVAPALLPAASEFKLNVPCEGNLKVEPAAALNFFDLAGYDSFGLRITTLRLGNTRLEWLKPGDMLNLLVYAARATKLTGNTLCQENATGKRATDAPRWNWDAALQPGWNVLNVKIGDRKEGSLTAVVNTGDLPATSGWFQFIGRGGLTMSVENTEHGQVRVVGMAADGAAARAGLQNGDIVLEIDGVSMKGLTSTQVAERVRGEPDTTITLKVLRDGKELTLTGTREFRRTN